MRSHVFNMLYTIENNKLKVTILSLGATINSFIDKETNTDMVLGFDKEEDYLQNRGPYLGATVGRYANRISKGTFSIKGIEYHTPINDKVNTLHGGEGFSFKEFSLKDKTENSVTFVFFSKDGDDGFPGNIDLEVKYELIENKLLISYSAISDKETVLNLTNHSYFNLDGGKKDIKDHELRVYTDRVALLDENGLSTDVTKRVDGTSFDFREFKKINDNFLKLDDNLSGGGIDHNFVFETLDMKKLVTIQNDKLRVTISSDLPDVQIYTSNFLGNIKGKYGIDYHNYYGVAIEPQYYPNSINYIEYLKPIIKANTEVKHFIEYKVEKR